MKYGDNMWTFTARMVFRTFLAIIADRRDTKRFPEIALPFKTTFTTGKIAKITIIL